MSETVLNEQDYWLMVLIDAQGLDVPEKGSELYERVVNLGEQDLVTTEGPVVITTEAGAVAMAEFYHAELTP